MIVSVRALIQRVSRASVRFPAPAAAVEGRSNPGTIAIEPRSIGRGVVVFLGIGPGDDAATARALAEKCAQLRIFSNDEGKFDHSLLDVRGEALVISQFTLYGDCRKGRRPDFTGALPADQAEPLYRAFVDALRGLRVAVQTGEFGARMEVEIINDGPVTLWLALGGDTTGRDQSAQSLR